MFNCRNLGSMSFLVKTSRTLEEFLVSAIRCLGARAIK